MSEAGKRVRESRGSLVPTGSDLTSDGSSVELDADLATGEEIPTTEEILRKGREARGTGDMPYKHPAPPHAPSGGLAGGAKETEEEREDQA